jgi:SurA-like protein
VSRREPIPSEGVRHARTFPRAIVGVALAALVATVGAGCTSHAGAAAQVGDTTIETSTLRGVVDRGAEAVESVPAEQAAQQLERPELQRRALTTLVQYQLIAAEAESLGVTVSQQDIDAYYQAYGVLQFGSVDAFLTRAAAVGFAEDDVRTIVETGALEAAITDKLFPDLIATEEAAQAQYDSIVEQVGEIPLPFEEAKPYLQRFLADDQRSAALRPVLVEAADREHISINPRFGVWDDTEFAVVAADGSVATTPGPVPSFDVSALS